MDTTPSAPQPYVVGLIKIRSISEAELILFVEFEARFCERRQLRECRRGSDDATPVAPSAHAFRQHLIVADQLILAGPNEPEKNPICIWNQTRGN